MGRGPVTPTLAVDPQGAQLAGIESLRTRGERIPRGCVPAHRTLPGPAAAARESGGGDRIAADGHRAAFSSMRR